MIAITVEEEEDIQKFKDYTPSSGTPPAAPEAKPAPSPPKEEKVEKPASAPEAKTSKPTSAPSEDRIFASPLAKKLAEDSNVSVHQKKSTKAPMVDLHPLKLFPTLGTSLKHQRHRS